MRGSIRLLGLNKGPRAQIRVGLTELLRCIHDDGAAPGHGLLEGLTGNQEKTDTLVPRLHHHLIATVEQDQGPIARQFVSRRGIAARRFREDGAGLRRKGPL